MEHDLEILNQVLKERIQEKYLVNREMQKQLLINIDIIAKHKDLMKLFLEIPDMESGGQLLVFIVEMYKVIEMFRKPLKEGFAQIKKMRTFTSEIVNLKETFLDSNKSHIKMIEEVSPEISKILVKLDKPVSLLELGLDSAVGFHGAAVTSHFEDTGQQCKSSSV